MSTKEHPIPFSDEMVRAVLDGRKTQTRRPVKPQPAGNFYLSGDTIIDAPKGELMATRIRCPFGGPGDRLWVRETWGLTAAENWGPFEIYDVLQGEAALLRRDLKMAVHYQATDVYPNMDWRRSSHMPRWASRINLEVTTVRVERVQDISDEDARAEGCKPIYYGSAISAVEPFAELWDSIYAKKGCGWNRNPWVWVGEWPALKPA